jgi:hypothetical protein
MTYLARFRVLAALFVAALAALAVPQAHAADVNVNCQQKQTIAAALTSLNRYGPNTITVSGTCMETVDIQQFDHLTIIGKANAAIGAIVAPSNFTYTLNIRNSRDVVLRNLTVRGPNGAALFESCKDCGVYNSTIEGTILVGSMSKLVIFKSVLHANGNWAAFGIFDNSVAFINDCMIEPGTSPSWVGLHVGKGAVVTMGGSTIRGFEEGINVVHGYLDLSAGYASSLPGSNPDQTVVIEDSWLWAIAVGDTGTANLGKIVRLRNNGAIWWGGGISAAGNSTVNLADGVEISNSGTDGLQLSWGSHASISAARISNSGMNGGGNGISLSDNSTAVVGPGNPTAPTVISGSAGRDILCDDSARFGGVANVSATKITCQHIK